MHTREQTALQWASKVQRGFREDQIYLEVNMPTRVIDFFAFKPGSDVSVYESFKKFELWDRGYLSPHAIA
jgi:hypothetical protein